MDTTNIPGRASDAGPALTEDADTRDWRQLAEDARDAVESATNWRTDRDTVEAQRAAKGAWIREAIDLLNLALERL